MCISCAGIVMKLVFGVLFVIPAYQVALGRLEAIPTDRDLTTTDDCQNFNFTSSDRAYLPSEVISISGVCDDTHGTKALCPSWNIISPLAEVIFLRNNTVRDGTTCIRVMEIQVLKFKDSTKRVQLLVEFEHPKSEPIKELNVERSDDGKTCKQSRDCYYFDQFCSPSGICTCSDGWIFIRNVEKCVPAITRIKGQCKYQEQCQISNSFCQYTGCECLRFYKPRDNYTQCTPEGRSYGSSCETDENCLIENVNTMCKDGSCYCKEGYTYDYEKGQKCLPNGSASFKTGFGWSMIFFVVTLEVLNILF